MEENMNEVHIEQKFSLSDHNNIDVNNEFTYSKFNDRNEDK